MIAALRRILPSPRSILVAVLVPVVLSVANPAPALSPEVVSSDGRSIRLTLNVDRPGVSSFVVDGVEYSIVSIPGASTTGEPGMPELPCVKALLGVPECDAVELDVAPGGTYRVKGVRVIPSPGLVRVGEGQLSSFDRAESDVYASGGVWPERPASLTGPRWLGTQRTVTVGLYP